MTDTNTPKVDEKMIDRVRKLFAMSQDVSSANEAAIALKRCMSLMQKYGITEADLTTSEFGSDASFEGKSIPKWRGYLALGIAKFTETVVTIKRERVNGVLVKKIVYSGFDADVQNAVLLSDYLEQTLARCIKRYKAETGNTGRAASNSFSLGFALALQDRMFEMSKEMEQQSPVTTQDTPNASAGTSLVVCKQKMVAAEFGKQRIKQSRTHVSDGSANNAGNEAGRNVNLNRQVSGNTQKALNAA